MTLMLQHLNRSADRSQPKPPEPQQDPPPRPVPLPHPQPSPLGPWGPTYCPTTLARQVYLLLWAERVIPAGPMLDPDGAERAAVDMLRAFGIRPSAGAR